MPTLGFTKLYAIPYDIFHALSQHMNKSQFNSLRNLNVQQMNITEAHRGVKIVQKHPPNNFDKKADTISIHNEPASSSRNDSSVRLLPANDVHDVSSIQAPRPNISIGANDTPEIVPLHESTRNDPPADNNNSSDFMVQPILGSLNATPNNLTPPSPVTPPPSVPRPRPRPRPRPVPTTPRSPSTPRTPRTPQATPPRASPTGLRSPSTSRTPQTPRASPTGLRSIHFTPPPAQDVSTPRRNITPTRRKLFPSPPPISPIKPFPNDFSSFDVSSFNNSITPKSKQKRKSPFKITQNFTSKRNKSVGTSPKSNKSVAVNTSPRNNKSVNVGTSPFNVASQSVQATSANKSIGTSPIQKSARKIETQTTPSLDRHRIADTASSPIVFPSPEKQKTPIKRLTRIGSRAAGQSEAEHRNMKAANAAANWKVISSKLDDFNASDIFKGMSVRASDIRKRAERNKQNRSLPTAAAKKISTADDVFSTFSSPANEKFARPRKPMRTPSRNATLRLGRKINYRESPPEPGKKKKKRANIKELDLFDFPHARTPGLTTVKEKAADIERSMIKTRSKKLRS